VEYVHLDHIHCQAQVAGTIYSNSSNIKIWTDLKNMNLIEKIWDYFILCTLNEGQLKNISGKFKTTPKYI